VRFYSLPPREVEWPYLMVNPVSYKELYRRRFIHAIVDCGVEFFNANPGAVDYPQDFLNRWKAKGVYLTSLFHDKVWITIPDYPDDYHPGQGSISKTIKNIEEFLKVKDVNWLPSIQARYLDELSLYESIQDTKAAVDGCPRLALGTVCKTNDRRFIIRSAKALRSHFPGKWLHAFGVTRDVIRPLDGVFDSCDSMAWTYPRNHGGHSCKTKDERISYFMEYVKEVVFE